MFAYGKILVSDEIIKCRFACDLSLCGGLCCSEGDAGAPLSDAEKEAFIEKASLLDEFEEPYRTRFAKFGAMTEVYSERLKKFIFCTSVEENGDCVFSFVKNGVYLCRLQSGSGTGRHAAGVSGFKKPVSCYLFPIREKRVGDITILNLYKYDECRGCYRKDAPLLVEFLKPVLIETYGAGFFHALLDAASAAPPSGRGPSKGAK